MPSKQSTIIGKMQRIDIPHLADASFSISGFESRGVLSDAASSSSVLMRLVWVARLGCFDLSVVVPAVTSQVAAWKQVSDRLLHRLVSYLASTLRTRKCMDPPRSCTATQT